MFTESFFEGLDVVQQTLVSNGWNLFEVSLRRKEFRNVCCALTMKPFIPKTMCVFLVLGVVEHDILIF